MGQFGKKPDVAFFSGMNKPKIFLFICDEKHTKKRKLKVKRGRKIQRDGETKRERKKERKKERKN